MPAPYQGNSAGVRPRQATKIDVPVDADPANAAVFQSPYEVLANLVAFLMEQAGLQDAANTFTEVNEWKGVAARAIFNCTVFTNGFAGDDQPGRMCTAIPTYRKLADELATAAGRHIRVYVGVNGIEFTENAIWIPATNVWEYEDPATASAIKVSIHTASGFRIFSYSGANGFGDVGWTANQVIIQPLNPFGPGSVLGATDPNVALIVDPGVVGSIAPVREPIHLVGTQGQPAFAGNWRAAPAFRNLRPVGFFRDAFGVVHIQGQCVDGTGLVFTLPAGYAPSTNLMLPYISDEGDPSQGLPVVMNILSVQPSGNVVSQGPAASGRCISLDGVTFAV